MKRRSFVQRQLRSMLWAFVKNNKLPALMLLGLYLTAVAAGRLLGGNGYWQGFGNGVLLAALVAAFLRLFLLHTGAINQVAGAYGETRTQEELEKAAKDGSAWCAVHNIELVDGDIDSVVFTPAGVLAVETKWRMRELDRRWLGRDLAQAQRSAGKARTVLRSKNVDAGVHDVIPLLVVWGKASSDVAPGGELLDGVHVVNGNELRDWLRRFADGPISRVEARTASASLAQFAKVQFLQAAQRA